MVIVSGKYDFLILFFFLLFFIYRLETPNIGRDYVYPIALIPFLMLGGKLLIFKLKYWQNVFISDGADNLYE